MIYLPILFDSMINPSCWPDNLYQYIKDNTPSLDFFKYKIITSSFLFHYYRPFKLNSAICSLIILYLY